MRKTEAPYQRVDQDPAAARRVAAYGNGLASLGTSGSLKCIRGARIQRIDVVRNALKLTLTNETVVEADHLVSLTGYRPNADLYRELHVHQCYASDGPMKLAATLLAAAAGGGGGDCLNRRRPARPRCATPSRGFIYWA